MFSPDSRYQTLPDIVTTDASGRTLASKTLRPLSQVPGTVRHVVQDGERLDHLAERYYRQPRKWWRLLDANPDLRAVPSRLGKEVVVTHRFGVMFNGAQAPWATLVERLLNVVGVEDVRISEDIRLVAEERVIGGRPVVVQAERFERAMLVTHNELTARAGDLAVLIMAAGFEPQPPERLSRVGSQIVIPRDVTG